MTDKTKDKPAPTPAPGEARLVPDIGVARVETAEEVQQTKENADQPVAPYDGDPREAHEMAADQSMRTASAGNFSTSDLPAVGMPPAEEVKEDKKAKSAPVKKEELYDIRLLYDWWDGQGIRHPRDEVVSLPLNEAKKLLSEGKGERADELTPSKKK